MPEKDISNFINDESFLNFCFGSNKEDVEFWSKWLLANPEYKAQVEEIKSMLILLGHGAKEKESDEQFKLLKQKISDNVSQSPSNIFHLRPWLFKISVAASLIILCTVGVLIYQHQREARSNGSLSIQHDILPGGNKAYLTLDNGKKISLTDAANGDIARQSGIIITKASDGQLVYTVAANAEPDPSGSGYNYNTIETPRGGQYQVRLPDGTHVWLNAASSLRYPVNFSTGERRVELKGEGYFEVAKDKKHPFIVKTEQQEVTVLGTRFNINAYSDEPGVNTALLEGSVLVNNLAFDERRILKPGEQSTILKNQSTIRVSDINVTEVMAWKSGYFIFDNKDIFSIMKVISRWYDVDIEYQNYTGDDRLGGTFSRSSNLSEILKNLEAIGKIHFKIKGRRIVISNIYE